MKRSLEDVQDEILDRIHAGERVDREAILEKHSEHGEALASFFEVLELVEGSGDGDGLALARLGEFRILREIGRGGMGRVYEAEQTSLKRRVALKVLAPALRLDEGLVSRFQREAEAAGRLRHPGIVPVFSVGKAAGTPFFVMELVEGVSLQQVLERRRAGEDAGLPTDAAAWRRWAVGTAAKVADALAYAHRQGILHRDVKPANILLDESGEPRLTDFGLALDLRAPELTQTGEVFGSPQYMSPEQALRQETPIDERTDVYSLAVTLYELLTLRLPYAGTTPPEVLAALMAGTVVPARKVDPSIPRALDEVVQGALRKDPRTRYRGAAELAHDLRATQDGGTPTLRPRVRPGRRLWVPLAAAGVVALLALGLAFVPGRDGDATPEHATAPPAAAPPATPSPAAAPPAAGPPAAATEPDPVARVLDEYAALGPNATDPDYQVAIGRLRAIDSAEARAALTRVYQDYIEGPGRDDAKARQALGYREFAREVPEVLSFRGTPYVRAVERATEKRWFGPDENEAFLLAEAAWEETVRHADGLATDRYLRSTDRVRARIGRDDVLGKYHVTTRWAGPYLLCHLAQEPSSVFDEPLPGSGGSAATAAEFAARRKTVEEILQAVARPLTALSAECTQRYAAALSLKPLMDPWGGRPDYQPTMRSFEDGVPLIVLVFEDGDGWVEALGRTGTASRSPLVAPSGVAHFSVRTADLYVHAESAADVEPPHQRERLLHEAVHQLQYWYHRQRRRWTQPPIRQDWFQDGLANLMAGTRDAADGTLEFTGLNRTRLESMQGMRGALQKQGREYPIFPLKTLVSLPTLGQVVRWGTSQYGMAPEACLRLFYDQAWALAYFLDRGGEGRDRDRFTKLCNATVGHATVSGDGEAPFRKALGIQSDEDYKTWDEKFAAFVNDHLLKLDTGE